MPEPVTIVALCLKVSSSAAQLIIDLNTLKARYRTVERNLQLLSSQVSALRSASSSLQAWLQVSEKRSSGGSKKGNSPVDEDRSELEAELRDLLHGSNLLLTDISEHLHGVVKEKDNVGVAAKTSYLWVENELDDTRKALGYQCDALLLVLQCLQM